MEGFKSKVGQNVVLRFSLRFQFMSQSSDSLGKTVNKNDFKMLRAGFPNIGNILFEKLIKKGFFTNNYFDSFENFNKPFPPHGPLWYNTSTTAIEITKEQHNFASGVFSTFSFKNIGDYRDFYLRTDVFLLGDFF